MLILLSCLPFAQTIPAVVWACKTASCYCPGHIFLSIGVLDYISVSVGCDSVLDLSFSALGTSRHRFLRPSSPAGPSLRLYHPRPDHSYPTPSLSPLWEQPHPPQHRYQPPSVPLQRVLALLSSTSSPAHFLGHILWLTYLLENNANNTASSFPFHPPSPSSQQHCDNFTPQPPDVSGPVTALPPTPTSQQPLSPIMA